MEEKNKVQSDAAKVQKESLKQNVITQPPSAKEVSKEFGHQLTARNPFADGGGKQKTDVNLKGEFKLRGKDLLVAVTRAAQENSELQGRQVDSATKRKTGQNGFAIGG